MTVTYSNEVATAKPWTFIKLLFRWRGSVYKLLYQDLILYLLLYYFVTIVHLFMLDENQRKTFEIMVKEFQKYSRSVPLSFVLGFFVSNVMTRWWNQYTGLPWPTSTAVYVSSTLHGYDEVGRAMRRTIIRYLCLSATMVFRVLSVRVKKRFPKLIDLIDAGLLNESEYKVIEELENKFPGYSKNWLPIVWAASIVTRARKEGRIRDDFAAKTIIQELDNFRGKCGGLMAYNSISIPLVYTQVVCIATYTYFLIALISNQHIGELDSGFMILVDLLPIFTILEFIFYMGWLKVAEALMNPFGEDDDDFDVNSMIDRNLQMGYLIVDDMHNDHPELLKDQYWNEMPLNLPDKAKEEDTGPVNQSFEADFIDYEVIKRNSRDVKILPISKEAKDSQEKIQRITISIDEGSRGEFSFEVTPVPSVINLAAPSSINLTTPSSIALEASSTTNLRPDATVIAEVYKKFDNVEAEQDQINQTLEVRRRKTVDKKNLDENEEDEN